ncbi:MAG: MFS transporter, partial [Bdellovibrio sp.]
PFFLFSTWAGQLSDRMEKARLIRLTKGAEVFAMILAAWGFLTNSYGFLLIVLFLMGLQSAFFGPLKYSILPQHLKTEELLAGNSLIEAGTFLAIPLGTSVGGWFVSFSGAEWSLALAVLVFAVLGLGTSFFIPPAAAAHPGLRLDFWPHRQFFQLWKLLREKSQVFFSVLGISWFWFLGASLLSILPTLAKQDFQASEEALTFLLTLFALGVGTGSLVTDSLMSFLSVRRLVLGAGFLLGAMLLELSCAARAIHSWSSLGNAVEECFALLASFSSFQFPWRPLLSWPQFRFILDLFVLAACGGVFIVPLYTIMQKESRLEILSQVVAANNIQNALFMVLSAGLVMVAFSIGMDSSDQMFVLGLLQLLFLLIWSLVNRRMLRSGKPLYGHTFGTNRFRDSVKDTFG